MEANKDSEDTNDSENENEITKDSKLISNPNCTTMGLVMALKPLHDRYTLSSMTPVAYQAVSGSGSEAVQSLNKETLLGDKLDSNYKDTYYPKPIARNVIPLAGNLTDNGYSDEEMKEGKLLGLVALTHD